MEAAKVSVIIPFFSNSKWLAQALESVFKQTYSDIEIIIVNDGSKEDISDILAQYNGRIIHIFKENGGPASARNVGIDAAQGEFIAFLDSDDLWEPDKTLTQVEFLHDSANIDWCHTNYVRFYDQEPDVVLSSKMPLKGEKFDRSLLRCFIATPCVMLRASLLKANPLLRFDTSTRVGEDTIFWFKLLAKNPAGYIDKPLVKVRLRGTNAAMQATDQLVARKVIYQHIKLNGNKINGRKIPLSVLAAYSLANFGMDIYSVLKLKNNAVAKFLYMPSWLMFRLLYFLS